MLTSDSSSILSQYHLLLLHQNLSAPRPNFPRPSYWLELIWSDNFYSEHKKPWVTRLPQIAFGGGSGENIKKYHVLDT